MSRKYQFSYGHWALIFLMISFMVEILALRNRRNEKLIENEIESFHGKHSPFDENDNKRGTEFPPDLEDLQKCKKNIVECENLKNYPREHIQKLIDRGEINPKWFKSNTLIRQATGNGDGESLCHEKKHSGFQPQGYFPDVSDNSSFFYIIQGVYNNHAYNQTFDATTCSYPKKSECKATDILSTNYRSTCVEKCIVVEGVIGLTQNGDVKQNFTIELPSCCVCKYQKK